MNSIGALTHVSFEHYKAFADRQTLELRPITLLFGYNSVGKSAALRLLPILSAASQTRPRPEIIPSVFNYSSPALRGASFSELLNAEHPGGSINIDLAWERASFSFAIREGAVGEGEFVSEFSWKHGAGNLDGHLGDDRSAFVHDVQTDAGEVGKVAFSGLHPDRLQSGAINWALNQIEEGLEQLSDDVHWLAGTRSSPARRYKFGPGVTTYIGPDGQGTAAALRASHYANDGVAAAVSSWLSDTCGCELAFAELDRVALSGPYDLSFSLRLPSGSLVSLSDVGEGIAQAIPVVTLLHQAKAGLLGDHPLLAIEQPELHLHPKASIRLAEELCECVAQGSPARHLVETHSESVLLAIQTAIVEGTLKSGEVIVYWVDQKDSKSTLTSIEFDDEGYPSDGWPTQVFREALDQARKLNALRRR